MSPRTPFTLLAARRRGVYALLVWAVAWSLMLALDRTLDLANLALLLVLASAIAGLWLRPAASALACAAAVLAFNWTFVPPRGTFSVDLRQHVWLLGAMLGVGWIVAALVARQRALAESEQRAAAQARQLRAMSDALRDSDQPQARGSALQAALAALSAEPVSLLMLRAALPAPDDAQAAAWLGEPNADVRAGLWLATRQAAALGPGTGRHEDQPHWYLPLRARGAAYGAAQLPARSHNDSDDNADEVRAHAQALCDQMGLALEPVQADPAGDLLEQTVPEGAAAQAPAFPDPGEGVPRGQGPPCLRPGPEGESAGGVIAHPVGESQERRDLKPRRAGLGRGEIGREAAGAAVGQGLGRLDGSRPLRVEVNVINMIVEIVVV